MIYVHYTNDRELPWKARDDDGVVLGEFKTGAEAREFVEEWKREHIAVAASIDESDLDAPSTETKVEGDDVKD